MAQKNAFVVRKAAMALAVALVFGAISLPHGAYAAGLGRLTVQSALGQPLRAEVEITAATPEELSSLTARLASQEAFKQAGLEFNAVLSGLRFSVDRRANRPVVRMSSSQPINEPFVDLLIELNWASGRLVREYTFLLDPPELRNSRTPEPIAPAASAPAAVPPAVSSPAPVASAPAAAPAPAPRAEPKKAEPASASEVKVKSGESLSKIAVRYLPSGVSLDQMLVALYRANPQAFAGNNMNRLKAGAVLRIPDANTAQGISTSDARKEVVAQTTDFSAYRNALAGAVAKTEAPTALAPATNKAAQGQVTARVDDKAAPKAEAKDQVKLARPQTEPGKPGAPVAGGNAAQADAAAAKEKALADANKRVAELERNVSEMQKQLALQNEAMAKAQQAAQAKAAPKAEPPKAEPAKVEPPKVEPPKAAAPKTEPPKTELAKLEPAKPAEPTKPAELPKAEAVKTEPAAAAPAPGAEVKPAPAEAPKAEVAKPADPTKPEMPKAAPAPAAPVVEQPGLMADLLGNPLALGGLAAVLGLGGGLFWYRRRQAKKFAQFQDSILTSGDLKSNSIFGATGGQSVDTNDSTFSSSFTPSASQIDSNEVDPIAEADVYIAYGRDAQAEEILKEALKTTPERQAVRVKLLEIYANRKDLGAFSSMAGELYQMSNGDGDDWARAAELGRSIDPRNPLYTQQGNSAMAAKVADASADLAAANLSATMGAAQALASAGAETEPLSSAGRTPPGPVQVDFDLDLQPQTASASDDDLLTLPTTTSTHATLAKTQDSYTLESRLTPNDNTALEVTQPAPALDFNLDAPTAAANVAPASDRTVEFMPLEASASNMTGNGPTTTIDVAKAPLDFDLNLPGMSTPASTVPEIDLSNISLDLDSGKASQNLSLDSIAADPASAKQQEMATKLDLAAAYQEIGDREGAKELLEEVLRGGDPQQQSRAQKMLETIG